jgi:hypothetical protein
MRETERINVLAMYGEDIEIIINTIEEIYSGDISTSLGDTLLYLEKACSALIAATDYYNERVKDHEIEE